MKKRFAAILCVFLMTTVLAACAGGKSEISQSSASSTQAASEKLDPVTLKILMWGNRPADFDKVVAEAERRMAGTLNVKLDVVFVPVSDIMQKIQMTLASGEEADLIWDSPLASMYSNIASGYYEPLDDLLKKYGQNILATRPPEMFEGNKVNGKTYGIPLGDSQYFGYTYLIRQDIRNKLGIAPIKTYDELVKFAYAVKAKEPGLAPILPSIGFLSEASFRSRFDQETQIRRTQAMADITLYYKNNDGKVYNLLDEMEPKVWDWIKNARKMYQDGIIHPDVLAIKDYEGEFSGGKAAIIPVNDFGVKNNIEQAVMKNVPGGKVEAVTFFDKTPKKNITNFSQWNFMSVPITSKHKERAIQFLNWTQQKENYDLLAYGIQGKNWEAVGDDKYKPLDSNYSWFPYLWIWNPTFERLNASQSEEVIELNKFTRDANNFEKDVLTGFQFDPQPVLNEMTKFKTIEDKYYPTIFNGVLDPDTAWADFKKEGGPSLKKIQQEMQKQIDAFLHE
ncbi:extracellular solute-binding protein [Cohnella silvisoli]|uniref:Extracellular solute-binding protein n=1 Tax=Cohnella silvisoli TaxID=2873699 RepID=A0ABV1L0N3_9BACL|nr:extracellular solute-binding protein [Cohnella silvisoli]MCD9025112.1 extracellular solute-binding protein [Cohnella silvisoli]